jgi:hypothetical protein
MYRKYALTKEEVRLCPALCDKTQGYVFCLLAIQREEFQRNMPASFHKQIKRLCLWNERNVVVDSVPSLGFIIPGQRDGVFIHDRLLCVKA